MRTIVLNSKFSRLGCWCFALLTAFVDADSAHFTPTRSPEARWVFSGVVSDEQQEQYGYFFQMARDGNVFRTKAALFDVQTKALILQDESQSELPNPEANHWHVGHAFLKFNPINDSWVFGFKQPNKAGFNFKVDMLDASEGLPAGQNLRPGIAALVSQAHALNGHLYIPNEAKEAFVTAKHTWFRQIETTAAQSDTHAVKGVLCQFKDDSAFYSINLPESDAIRGAMTGRLDETGAVVPMSQFIHVEARIDGPWTIVPSPEQKVTIASFLEQSSMVSGIAELENKAGFCVLSEDTIGQKNASTGLSAAIQTTV